MIAAESVTVSVVDPDSVDEVVTGVVGSWVQSVENLRDATGNDAVIDPAVGIEAATTADND